MAFFIFVFNANLFRASTPALERELSLSIKNESISSVLKLIEGQVGLVFSYSPLLLKDVPPITLHVKNKSVREVLSLILPFNVAFKVKNNYIILKEKEIAKNLKSQKISGYVYDAQTDKKVANVTIYDKKSLESTTSDEYGYYSISMPANNTSLTVNRVNYEDTSLQTSPTFTSEITNISIQPISDSLSKKDSAQWQKKLTEISKQTNLLVNKFNQYIHTLNIRDSLERHFQVSFLPFIGTNHKLSGNVYNKFSFNILGGYSRGTKEFELGGLFNIDKENVKGIQISSLFNLVGDSLRGVQIAGLFNLVGKKTSGVQIAAVQNLNGGPMRGLQIAGVMNLNDSSIKGVQIATVLNLNRGQQSGNSISACVNLNASAQGVNIAGLTNMQRQSKGILIAGLGNISKETEKTFELAGLFNYAEQGNNHVQVATLFNRSQKIKVLQLACVNYADTAQGIPIGLFSFVKKGIHQLEFASDEVQYFNINFRTGVPAFYNIFYSGLQPSKGEVLWSFGYGLGTSIRLAEKWRVDLTASAKHLSYGSFYKSPSERLQLYVGIEYKLKKRMTLAAGPVMNWFISDTKSEIYSFKYTELAPSYHKSSISVDGLQNQYWLGLQISLRFF